jgi:polysaccharide biosynthesis transport protein
VIEDLQQGATGNDPRAPLHADVPRVSIRRPAEDPHLVDYARVLVKRRHVALTAFATVLLGTAVYSFTTTPVYEGRVQLLIEADTPNIVSFAEVINEGQNRQDYYQTQYRLLQSRGLAKKTIEALQLWNHTELTPDASAATFSVRGVAGSVISWLGLAGGVPPEPPDEDESAAQARTIDAVLSRLTVTPVRNSRLVNVAYRSEDARFAAQVANALVNAYVEQNLDFRFTASREASEWLNGQLAQQRQQVETAEIALQRYREQNGAISLEDRENIVVQKLTDLNTALTRAKTERLQKEAMYRQLTSVQHDAAALDTFPAILSNPFIGQQKGELAKLRRQEAELADRLGERHPEMIKVKSAIEAVQTRIDGEVGNVLQGLRTEYQAAVTQEQSLNGALEQQKGEAMSMNRRAIEYSVLMRDVESSKQVYDSLLQRAKETGISGELRASNVRVVDAAEPSHTPVSPRRTLYLLMGLFGGSVLGIGLAFFLEYLDDRVKTPHQIETELGLPSLGLIPVVSTASNPLINTSVPANFAEAFRGLRTNVLFSSADDGSRSIVVTSTGPSEGKTMVASNLAVAMAQTGQRVLLIDGDMRRPRGHEVFALPLEPGLSNVLIGATKPNQAIHQTPTENLSVMAAGTMPPNPAELLGSPAFARLLASTKEQFDLVLVDTPPIMAVTDAAIVGHRADGLLFVIAADATSRRAAQQAIDQLEHARVRFLGAVLNRVDLERNAYYYARYYRKDYATYYTTAPTTN